MKTILSLIVGGLYVVVSLLTAVPVHAMDVSDPKGSVVNGWYKDRFTIEIDYGTDECFGEGTKHEYIFTAGSSYDGKHAYSIFKDQNDNPYLSLDGQFPPKALISPLTCPVFSPYYVFEKDLGIIGLDALSPTTSITAPSDGTSTTASTITISGTANDSASGIAEVRAIVNGATGPAASLSGNTFSVVVSLAEGVNKIEVRAQDLVGHTAVSNTVKITRSTTSGGTSGSSGSSSSTGGTSSPTSSGSTAPSSSTSQSPTGTPQKRDNDQVNTALKFNQQNLLNINRVQDGSSDPVDVLKSQGLAGVQGKTYYGLIFIVLLLLAIAIFVIWQFLPIFKKLDKTNSGLRRRIILIVALPSLVPLIAMGFLGYQQLTSLVERSLSGQLARASQVSALKLERELSVRDTIVTNTSDGILQIRQQIADRNVLLAKRQQDCLGLVRTLIPQGKYRQVTSSDSCLPFLTGFAQLAGAGANNTNSYVDAVNAGYDHALKASQAEQQQRIDEQLGSLRQYFPEIIEIVIVNDSEKPETAALLPPSDKKAVPLSVAYPDLLVQARLNSLFFVEDTNDKKQLIITYPIAGSNKKVIGGAVVKYNLGDRRFVGGVWQATPKPVERDMVFIVNSQGIIIYPSGSIKANKAELNRLSKASLSDTIGVTINGSQSVARVSPVGNTDWSFVVASPKEFVLAPIAGIQRTALLAIAASIIVSILLGFLFVTGIAREIERLLAGALAFAKGNLGYRIELGSKDELQVLGDTMNQMAADIKAGQEALIEKDKEFINVATHELRTPLTAVIGNLSMIADERAGTLDDMTKDLLDQASRGAYRLRELVNDMLDVARLESGREEFKLEPVDIKVLSSSIVEMQAITAQQKSINLVGSGLTNTEYLPSVMADQKKLQIVLTNFISNAIKYNQPGGTVNVQHRLDGDMLITSVADNGLGIPEDQKSHIFEKFYRVAHADRAEIVGTGLGLYITKRYVEQMGGRAWFESEHGKGTTFFFSLPVQPAIVPTTAVVMSEIPAVPQPAADTLQQKVV